MAACHPNQPQIRVVIPARNEATTIAATLDALRTQVDLHGRPLDPGWYEVTVLANNCDDSTAAVIRGYADRHAGFPLRLVETRFPGSQANIGTARRTVFEDACRRFEAAGIDGIIATTDADTHVARDWIAATLAEFAAGAEAVGGRIFVSPVGPESLGPPLRMLHLRDTAYRMLLANLEALVDPQPCDPFPRHHQHFGASLAVRASAYRRAGGIPAVMALEDMAFYTALTTIDAAVRHSPRVRAITSGRRDGRVAMGLSTQLGEWAAAAKAGQPRIEEPASRSLKRMELVRERRRAWQRSGPLDGFDTFGCYRMAVQDEIEHEVQRTSPYRPALLEQVIQELRLEVARRSKRSSR